MREVRVKKNSYVDSVALMSLTRSIKQDVDVVEVMVAMATPMNLEILSRIGFAGICEGISANDLVIAVEADSDEVIESCFELVEKRLRARGEESVEFATNFRSLREIPQEKDLLVVISVPGEFAAREASIALDQGMDVMLFSDNVPIQDELRIKRKASKKGLLVMGPDCGTAHLEGYGICFSNAVRRGSVGIVAASGTGCQEVMVQLDRLGAGISNAFGTGGRDLHQEIGGITMFSCLDRLEVDPKTEVIVCISKPPDADVRRKMMNRLASLKKPVVACFLGDRDRNDDVKNVVFASNLFDAARQAARLALKDRFFEDDSMVMPMRHTVLDKNLEIGKIVGLYCGGTLCYEALDTMADFPDVFSNLRSDPVDLSCAGHFFVDLGDDEFTRGRPHPMIEPDLRNPFLIQAARKKDTRVIVLDFELGFGSHQDPVGESIEVIRQILQEARDADRKLSIVAYVCGTESDLGFSESVSRLIELGVQVAPNNFAAIQTAIDIVVGESGGRNEVC